MKKILILTSFILFVNGCSILSELTAFTKCEFRLHSFQDPAVCGINVQNRHSWSDFSFMDGQVIAGQLLKGSMPFDITVNVEVKNPGTTNAAVNSIEWMAYIDDIEVAKGIVNERVEVKAAGGLSMVPVKIQTDLFEYLEGDNPRTMMNFALNLVDAGDQPTRLSMKIKPSVLMSGQTIHYPGYFTITHVFSGGD